MTDSQDHWTTSLLNPLRVAILFVMLLWVLHMLRVVFPGMLHYSDMGIYPRRLFGLSGILTAPMAHSTWTHLISNSVPLFAMIIIIWGYYKRVSWQAFMMIYLLTGISVWLFGRSVFHVGASGVVYGLVAFVFWSGVFRRSIKSIVLSLIVVMLYMPMWAGVLPNQEGISWESHLLGGLAGVFVAWWFKSAYEPQEMEKIDFQDEEKTPFLRSDTFDKTRHQREMEQWSDKNEG